MTLTEIAQYAGEKIGKTNADTLTFLQKSASLNYRRVWNFAAWRETVTTSTYSVGTASRTVSLGSTVENPLSRSLQRFGVAGDGSGYHCQPRR
jgi:hypothetical protein